MPPRPPRLSSLGAVGSTRVLLLAGTTEAASLAELLAGRSDVEVVASFAGRTRAPARTG